MRAEISKSIAVVLIAFPVLAVGVVPLTAAKRRIRGVSRSPKQVVRSDGGPVRQSIGDDQDRAGGHLYFRLRTRPSATSILTKISRSRSSRRIRERSSTL